MIHSRPAVELFRRIGVYAGASVFLFAAVASGVQAAEENGAAASTEIFKWINFAIVAAVIIWVFAKKLPPIFRGNAERISSAIGKASITKAEADRQLRAAETKLGNMKQEIDALRATAEKDSVAEGERLYRHLLAWPGYLDWMAGALRATIADDRLRQATVTMRASLAREADILVVQVPPALALQAHPQAKIALNRFSSLIPQMIVVGRLLEGALPKALPIAGSP